jgi:hypothetical protein
MIETSPPSIAWISTATAEATVTYKCTNDASTTYYILALGVARDPRHRVVRLLR